ncbi:MAG: tetratricopeptide repeat protein [Armatimonadota bacterium]
MTRDNSQTKTNNKQFSATTEHSYGKIAVALFTSPGVAYTEILKRRLLEPGLFLALLAGTLFCTRTLLASSELGPLHYFALGRYNPVTWFGLYLLYALATQKLLKWIGTEIDYPRVLTIMGWAQVSLVLVAVFSVAGFVPALRKSLTGTPSQFIESISAVLQIAYVVLIAIGINVVTSAPIARGIMTYVVVSFAASIAFGITYGNARLKLFEDALPGILAMAQQVASSDSIPWLGAATVGLYIGLRELGRELGWNKNTCARRALLAGLLGAVIFGLYLSLFTKHDYYGRLITVQRDYELGKLDKALREMKALLPVSKYASAGLILDIADVYYISGKPSLARSYYKRFEKLVHKAKLDKEDGKQLARPLSGIGATYDQEGRYDQALVYFQKATTFWPEFKDPWVRLVVTHARLGNYKKALEYSEHTSKKLKSKAAVLQVALIQAYLGLDDESNARKAYKELERLDDELAKRIGATPASWKNAVSKLTAKDLKFPLEKEVVCPPSKPTRKSTKRVR